MSMVYARDLKICAAWKIQCKINLCKPKSKGFFRMHDVGFSHFHNDVFFTNSARIRFILNVYRV